MISELSKAILVDDFSFLMPDPMAEGKVLLGEKGKECSGDWLLVRR